MRRRTPVILAILLLALAVPLMDTALSIYRRLRRGGPIMAPDRQHMHHRIVQALQTFCSEDLGGFYRQACGNRATRITALPWRLPHACRAQNFVPGTAARGKPTT